MIKLKDLYPYQASFMKEEKLDEALKKVNQKSRFGTIEISHGEEFSEAEQKRISIQLERLGYM